MGGKGKRMNKVPETILANIGMVIRQNFCNQFTPSIFSNPWLFNIQTNISVNTAEEVTVGKKKSTRDTFLNLILVFRAEARIK